MPTASYALESTPENEAENYVSLTGLAMTLFSLIALAIHCNTAFLVFFTALILASQCVPWRLAKGSAGAWGARTLIIGSVLIATIVNPALLQDMFYFVLYLHLMALLCAGEIVLQCWQSPSTTNPREAGLVLLSSVIFTAASAHASRETRYIWVLTPLYILAAIFTLRQFRSRSKPNRLFLRYLITGKLGLGALIFAILLGLSVSTGIAVYRDDISRWSLQWMSTYRPQETTGFSTHPKLGKVFQLKQSSRRVLKVSGTQESVHLRGATYNTYQQGSWGDADRRSYTQISATDLRAPKLGRRLTISHLQSDHSYFFMPLHTAGLEPPQNTTMEFSYETGGPLRFETIPRAPFEYTAILSEDPNYQGFLCNPNLNLRSHYRFLQRPHSLDDRIPMLAQKIVGNATTPQAKINAVISYLNKHHHYSLSIDPGIGDPVENFLLEEKDAHCEYFATAATILLRCVDVPSRYVTGYVAHEKMDTSEIIVRDRDAHAWAESFVEGIGWVTVEATPANGRPEESDTSLPFWTRIWEWIQDVFANVRDWLIDLTPTQMISIVGLIGICFGLLQVWRQWRSKQRSQRPHRPYYSPNPKYQRLANAFEIELKRHGKICPDILTWQEFIEVDTSSELNSLEKNKQSVLIREFVLLYNSSRFSDNSDETPQHKQDWEKLETILKNLQATQIGKSS